MKQKFIYTVSPVLIFTPLPMQVSPSPTYPDIQAQVKLPMVLEHIALVSQLLPLPSSLHSSISVEDEGTNNQVSRFLLGVHLYISLPLQVSPSPVNPTLQSQVKLPTVLVHCALASQLSAPVVHSLTSSNIEVEDEAKCPDCIHFPYQCKSLHPQRIQGYSHM